MSQVVGLLNNLYKPITNTKWIRARLCKLQKGYNRLAAASDKVYQLLVHSWWFSPGAPDSSTTKTGRYNIAEILLKVALNTKNQIKNQIIYFIGLDYVLHEYISHIVVVRFIIDGNPISQGHHRKVVQSSPRQGQEAKSPTAVVVIDNIYTIVYVDINLTFIQARS